jgi:DNA polymerase III epsilon subunit-like protein
MAASRTHGLSLEELRLHAPDSDKVMELLIEWQEKLGYRPVPISHNWPFERGFLLAWLGDDLLGDLFDVRARDTMAVAAAMNDRAVLNAEEPPFERLTLTRLCRKLQVNNDNPHDALSDAIACADVYKRMLQIGW